MSDRCFIVVGIADYTHRPRLPGAAKDRSIWQSLLRADGYVDALPIDPGWDCQTLNDQLTSWSIKQARAAGRGETIDVLVLVWSGHAVPTNDGLMLLAKDAPADDGSVLPGRALPVQNLATYVLNARPRHALLVIDTCYSDAGAAEAIQHALARFANEAPFGFATIASCGRDDTADDGRLALAMRKVMTGDDTELRSTWSVGAERLLVSQIHGPLRALLEREGAVCTLHLTSGDFFVLANPLHDASATSATRPSVAIPDPTAVLSRPVVLVVDDLDGEIIRGALDDEVHCVVVPSRQAAIRALTDSSFRIDAAVVDLYLDPASPAGGREVLEQFACLRPEVPHAIVSSDPYSDVAGDRRDYEFLALTAIRKSPDIAQFGRDLRSVVKEMLEPAPEVQRARVRAQLDRAAEQRATTISRQLGQLRALRNRSDADEAAERLRRLRTTLDDLAKEHRELLELVDSADAMWDVFQQYVSDAAAAEAGSNDFAPRAPRG